MKLISCYIESFGGLKNKRFDFSDGLNKLIGDNGTGKTTLSVFIKVMLYGMNDTRKTSLEENDRRHYLPWSGGNASGSLEFSAAGKRYRAERSFSAKAAEDSFALFDLSTGRRSQDYSEQLGREIFGIDADGFERTVFLSERNLTEAGKNQSVAAKLGGLVGCDGDIEGMDSALKALEEERRQLAKKGGGGRIYDIKASISETELRLNELAAIEGRMAAEKERLEIGKKRIRETEKSLQSLEGIKENLIFERAQTQSKERAAKLSEELKERERSLRGLEELFSAGAPTYEQINEQSYKHSEAKRLLAKRLDNPEYDRLKSRFTGISESEINAAEKALEEIGTKGAKSKSTPSPFVGVLLIGISLIIFGLVLGMGENVYLSLLSAVGSVLTLISAVMIGKGKKKSKKLTEAVEALAEKLPEAEGESPFEKAAAIIKEYKEFSSLSAFLRYRLIESEENRKRGEELASEADAFLAKYRISGENPFESLRSALSEYERIKRECSAIRGELSAIVKSTQTRGTAEESLSEEELTEKKRELTDRLNSLRRETALSERTVSGLALSLEERDELLPYREQLAEQLHENEEKLRIILLTKEMIEKAKDLMSSKYLGKTKSSFERYTRLISPEDSGSYEMNTDFAVSRLEGGRAKGAESYSRGTKDLYNIASRLALIDSLYDKETPPIILDDPFITLDDGKARAALRLLGELSAGRQIIYFSCSKARS